MNCCGKRVKTEYAQSTASAICRACGKRAKKVERITVEHILKGESHDQIKDTQYYFCETPSCDVVYFSNEAEQYFTKREVRVRVGIKETQDPITICYCFDFTEEMLRDELLTKGRATIPDIIAAEIKAGHCACDVKNPSGRCCLGEVNKAVKRVQAQTELNAQADATGNEIHNCCAPKPGLAEPIIQSQEVNQAEESSL